MMHHCDIVYRIVALVSRYVSYREKLYHCSPYDDVDDTFHYHVDQFFLNSYCFVLFLLLPTEFNLVGFKSNGK